MKKSFDVTDSGLIFNTKSGILSGVSKTFIFTVIYLLLQSQSDGFVRVRHVAEQFSLQ